VASASSGSAIRQPNGASSSRPSDSIRNNFTPGPTISNSGIQRAEIRAETPYLASSRKHVFCKGSVVQAVRLKLETHHPVIEPVSTRAGNGNLGRGDKLANGTFCQAETARRDTCGCEKSPFWRDKR
jgi:hypothetical protein